MRPFFAFKVGLGIAEVNVHRVAVLDIADRIVVLARTGAQIQRTVLVHQLDPCVRFRVRRCRNHDGERRQYRQQNRNQSLFHVDHLRLFVF